MAERKRTASGQRPRHVPQRTCIACRRSDAKRELVRLVRTAEGTVEIDPSGKRHGRGAYLCADRQCWDDALGRGALIRTLRIERLSSANRDILQAYARTLPIAAADQHEPAAERAGEETR
jgi:predicted RNA-binding protein YlxR (DUF448 family)